MVLEANVTGSAPLRFQWYRAGVALAGATNALLTFAQVSEQAAGEYYVVVGNDGGFVTNAPTLLAVAPLQVVSGLAIRRDGDSTVLLYVAGRREGTLWVWEADRVENLETTRNALWVGPVPASGSGEIVLPQDLGVGSRFFRFTVVNRPETPDPAKLSWIEPGSFWMGSPETELGREDDEGPLVRVTLSRGLYAGRFEVTRGEFQPVMGYDPSANNGDSAYPVVDVTWREATDYRARLTATEFAASRLPEGFVYRLPTEAEWEYLCRAGSTNRFSVGDDLDYSLLADYAWFEPNSGGMSHPVGQRRPNPWGLYDVHGNAAEWCSDGYGPLPTGFITDPLVPFDGESHVARGGSYSDEGEYCRSAYRLIDWTTNWFGNVGFRLVLARARTEPAASPMELAWIPAGSFRMGGNPDDPDAGEEDDPAVFWGDEFPNTVVSLDGFFMGRFEVPKRRLLRSWAGT